MLLPKNCSMPLYYFSRIRLILVILSRLTLDYRCECIHTLWCQNPHRFPSRYNPPSVWMLTTHNRSTHIFARPLVYRLPGPLSCWRHILALISIWRGFGRSTLIMYMNTMALKKSLTRFFGRNSSKEMHLVRQYIITIAFKTRGAKFILSTETMTTMVHLHSKWWIDRQ